MSKYYLYLGLRISSVKRILIYKTVYVCTYNAESRVILMLTIIQQIVFLRLIIEERSQHALLVRGR